MSQRLVTSKCPYKCQKKIYGALDLIENNRKKHSQGNQRYDGKKTRGKKGGSFKRSSRDARTAKDVVSRTAGVVDEREKTKLTQLLNVYGEQNSPAYRQGFDIKDYRPAQRPHLPELPTSTLARGSVLRTSSHVSLVQDRPPSLSKTQTLTLPDIHQKPVV